MAQTLPTIKLAVYSGDKLVSESTFQRDVINIGKMSRSHLRLDDDNVSRMHSAIEVTRSGAVELADLGSTNGTYLNGQRITRKELRTGDEIVIGNTRLVVEVVAPVVQGEVRRARVRAAVPPPKVYDPKAYLLDAGPDFDTNNLALEVVLLWGNTALSSRSFSSPTTITVGTSAKATIQVPTDAAEESLHELVQASGGSMALNLAAPFDGEVRLADGVKTWEELRSGGKNRVDLAADVRARVDLGQGFTALVGYQKAAARPKTAVFRHVKLHEQIYMALSLIAHLGFLIMLSLIPEEQLISRRDPYERKKALIQAIQLAEQEKKEEEPEVPEEAKEELKREFEVEVEEVAEVKEEVEQVKPIQVEQQEKRKEDALLSKLNPEQRKEYNRAKIQNVGLNKILNDTSLMKDLTETGDPLTGINTEGLRVLASPNSKSALTTLDPFGGSLQNQLPGGDGGFQVPLETMGGGGGPGGRGSMVAELGKDEVTGGSRELGKVSGVTDRDTKVKVDIMSPEVSEGYPREHVRRVIRANMGQIKYCYQQALQRDPELGGKVVLSFLIQPTGGVEAPRVSQNTMPDSGVGECIVTKLSRWKFPAPPNGMVVKVSYPFLFKAK